jgi:hypothetical protein
MSFLKRNFAILLVIILSVFTLLPLFHPGFFPLQDDEQIGRLYDLHKDVLTGQLPPRLAQDLGFGFDYPLFNYYPSFVYYVGEIFHLFGFSLIISTKLMIVIGFLLSGIFMYLFAKEYTGRVGGIVAAIAYTYAPYHSVDVYVRGAFPEFWSFVFVPAIFWSIYKLAITGKNRYIIVSSLFVAGLVLSHDLMAMMSSFFLGAYFLYLIAFAKEKRKLFFKICLSVLWGLGITAFFWMPAYFEKQYTMVNLLTDELADYHLHFVYLKQFLFSPWGYGGSIYGLDDGLSFQVGQSQLVLGILSVLGSFVFLIKKRKNYSILLLFIFLFFFSLFIQTQHSEFIWDAIQPFSYIQFPWRFLMFSDFTVAFLAAYIFVFIKNQRIQIILASIMICLLIFMNKDFFQPEKYLTTATDASYTAPQVIQWRTSIMSFEYTPKGISTKMSTIGNTVINITQNELPKKSFAIVSGKMTVNQLENIPQQKEFAVNVAKPGLLRLNTFTFPGWKTFIDGREVAYNDNNKFKLITISLSKGKHTVRATFTDTPLRLIANLLSGVCLLCVIIYGLLKKEGLKKKRYEEK